MNLTNGNWKAASQEFQSALKARKPEKEEEGQEEKEEMQNIKCSFCDKIFSEVFFEKHLETCQKKKEKEAKERKKVGKK